MTGDLTDAEAAALFRMALEDDGSLPPWWLLRPGGSWAAKGGLTTLVGYDPAEAADGRGRRTADMNAGTVLNPALAAVLCESYNARMSAVNSRRRARADCAAELRAVLDRAPGSVDAAALEQLADEWCPR